MYIHTAVYTPVDPTPQRANIKKDLSKKSNVFAWRLFGIDDEKCTPQYLGVVEVGFLIFLGFNRIIQAL